MRESINKHLPKVDTVHKLARSVPLGAAVVSPLIALFDIPALSQPWYFVEGDPRDDDATSMAFSAISLSLCAIGNGLLFARFSSNKLDVGALIVEAPLVVFWVKTIFELVNLGMYGNLSSPVARFQYGEGFWCATFSCGLSGLVALCLTFHFIVQCRQDWKDSLKIRIDGRHMWLSVSAFVAVMCLQGLVFSKIEGWYYFDGVYYSVVTCLTLSFGDFAPTQPATKVILFPFTILAFTLLANQISVVLGYFRNRSELRSNKYRAQQRFLSKQGRSVEDEKQWGLKEEMEFLTQMQKRERKISQLYNMAFSLVIFCTFWLLGGVIFKYSENWSTGNAMYFALVFFLTIGYGNFAPTSSFGRVFLVFYSLFTVPVIASFAVQALTTIIKRLSKNHLENQLKSREHHIHRDPDADPVDKEESSKDDLHAHQHLVYSIRNRFDRDVEAQEDDLAEEPHRSKSDLISEALDLGCQLESLSRSMLISALPKGEKAQVMLRADRNVQRRDITAVGADSDDMRDLWKKEDELVGTTTEDPMNSLRLFRETFAKFLVTGAQIRGLEGKERQAFLRVRTEKDEDNGSITGERAEKERKEMDDMDGDVEVQTSDGEQLEVKAKKDDDEDGDKDDQKGGKRRSKSKRNDKKRDNGTEEEQIKEVDEQEEDDKPKNK